MASVRPFQKQEKLPATNPERMVRPAPPSVVALTTSWQCALRVLVNTRVSSGMIAAARVPQLMIVESFHHRVGKSGASMR